MIQDMFASAVAAHHCEVIDRLNTGTNTCEEAGGTGGSLCQQHRVTNALPPDLFLYCLGQALNEAALHIFVAVEAGEGSLFGGDIRRCLISCVADRLVDALDDWQ